MDILYMIISVISLLQRTAFKRPNEYKTQSFLTVLQKFCFVTKPPLYSNFFLSFRKKTKRKNGNDG